MTTDTRTYQGETGTTAFDGYMGLRRGQRYTGVGQGDGTVRVSAVGARGVSVTAVEWEQWFRKG